MVNVRTHKRQDNRVDLSYKGLLLFLSVCFDHTKVARTSSFLIRGGTLFRV